MQEAATGAVGAWQDGLARHGTKSFAEVLEPAIALAEEGVTLDPPHRDFLNGPVYRDLAAEYPDLAGTYGAPGDRMLGERLKQPALARSLRALARDGAGAFYDGRLGETVLAETHGVTEFYSGIPCSELPRTAAGLLAALPSEGRAFVVLFLQRGRIVGAAEQTLQSFVEKNMRLLARSAPKRFDLHRFETRLYLWR